MPCPAPPPPRPARVPGAVLRALAVALLAAVPAAGADDDPPAPLPPVEGEAAPIDAPPAPSGFGAWLPAPLRLAAFGDPQDLQEPLLADDLAPPGQPRQEFEPRGRKLPPGAKPGALQQLIFTAT